MLPAPTVTDSGVVNSAESSDSVTVAPPVLETVTVQVVLALEPRVAGLHVNPLTVIAVTSEMVAGWVLPFSVAVMVAV